MAETPFLKLRDVAALYGVTPAAVRAWVREGKLKPSVRTPSNKPLWRASDLPGVKAAA